jgi:enoyl-CoA hydratase/carnithine racemase
MTTLTIGDGQRFNALDRAGWRGLEASARALHEVTSTTAVVIRGHGNSFSSGSDLRDWADASADDVRTSFVEIEAALQAVESIPVPTIAVIEGVAAGAGCQLALACDLQLMESTARIGMPTSQLGILISPAFANRMSMRIGPSRTKELLYSGRMLTADEAVAMGLVTNTAPAEDLDNELATLVDGWGRQSAVSLRAAKSAVNEALAPLEQPSRQQPVGQVADPVELSTRVDAFLHRHDRPARRG